MAKDSFEWDPEKDLINQTKHGVSFAEAQYAFADSRRVIAKDLSHSTDERRYFCFGDIGGWHPDSQVHLPAKYNQNIWCWLLAEREANL